MSSGNLTKPTWSVRRLLAVDEEGRLAHETIVSPGHQIERTFRYPGRG